MKGDAIYGSALIVGSLGGFVTMALHPTGSQLMGDFQHVAPVVKAVHALALVSVPISTFGAIGLTRRLASDGELAIAAFVAYAFGATAIIIAGVADGLLAPDLFAQLLGTTGDQHEVAASILRYNGHINQAFARVYVMASSAATLLWSAAILSTGRMARGAGVLGAAVGVIAIVAVAIGHLRLDVHGFGAIVLAQGIWMITAGVLLIRSTGSNSERWPRANGLCTDHTDGTDQPDVKPKKV